MGALLTFGNTDASADGGFDGGEGGCYTWQGLLLQTHKICRSKPKVASALQVVEAVIDVTTGDSSSGVTCHTARNVATCCWLP
eukprot:1943225-Amphidinium_carterae.1